MAYTRAMLLPPDLPFLATACGYATASRFARVAPVLMLALALAACSEDEPADSGSSDADAAQDGDEGRDVTAGDTDLLDASPDATPDVDPADGRADVADMADDG